VHTKGENDHAGNRQHLKEHGQYPETVALWGLDAIKTRGESLGILLELVGQNL